MPTKVSESKLFGSIVLFAVGLVLLLKAKLFAAPVRVSEKGLAFLIIAFALLAFAVRLWRRAFVKV